MTDSDIPPPPSSRAARRSGVADGSNQPHRKRGIVTALFSDATRLDLRILGRVLGHAGAVGAAAGAVVCAFYYLLELGEELLIEALTGYARVQAAGELGDHPILTASTTRPWLLPLIPAAGALIAGAIAHRFADEARAGGTNVVIDAFHKVKPKLKRRLIWVKTLATLLTLSSGGAGGREGPTMLIGGTIGSTVASWFKTTPRERRILLVAGMAAGTAAMFRTPLGAALLAVELLYQDDFEAEALIPAVLASVMSFSVFIAVHGEGTLFATADSYPFIIWHLPLYALMTVLLSMLASAFLGVLHNVQRISQRWSGWWRAGVGGLGVGLLAMLGVLFIDPSVGMSVLGGGYGATQAAITGSKWIGHGGHAIAILLALCAAKIFACALTVGTGASAGVFAPSLAIGALFGGAFGHAMQYLWSDPTIDPGAFALVGMSAFYGGLAHAPLGALVIVCELAGSYDLLVPLMLAQSIAFVSLRKRSLYPAQPVNLHDSVAHPLPVLDVLSTIKVRKIMSHGDDFVHFDPGTPVPQLMQEVRANNWQDVFPVLDKEGKVIGMITPELLRLMAGDDDIAAFAVALDAMQAAVHVKPEDDPRVASERMISHGLRELMVINEEGRIAGFIDEAYIGQQYLQATR
ncbi:MAG: chloride channel protein, partial [Polyangiaceae bacterium]